jgi:hypothetical protein
MSIEKKQLIILPFPQHILLDGGENKLICNVVVMPRNNPFDNLVNNDDRTAFVSASFRLKAWLVKGESDKLPTLEDHVGHVNYQPKLNLVFQNNNRENIFNSIASEFEIDPNPVALTGKAPVVLKKYLPEAYRNAFSFSKPRNNNGVTDDSYFCSLKDNSFIKPYVRNDKVNWGQILAFALSQPLLAKALGILYTEIEIKLDNADDLKDGGWIYFDFDETDLADTTLHLTNSKLVQYYAARISATTITRQVFAPVLFPVLEVDDLGIAEATVPFDDVFKDVIRYDDGFAKIVHCSQAVDTNPILEKKEGPSPLMDTGIRLGWDDEQLLTWMQRSFDDTHSSNVDEKAHSKLAVSRYRVDVAEISQDAFDSDDISLTESEVKDKWKSQVAIASKEDLKIGDFSLGSFKGESGVQISPARSNGMEKRLWLPAFFAFWNGTSLAVPDPIPEEINNLAKYKTVEVEKTGDKNAPALYKQLEGTEMELKYGQHYAFRVRLSDISGGGPNVEDKAIIAGENGICKHKFTRNVAPLPPAISDEESGLKIIRPRLGYPAILFAAGDKDKAVELLIEDRKALDAASANLAEFVIDEDGNKKYVIKDPANFDLFKKASREVSIADPDVDKLHIVVEAITLDMDREDSYNALHATTPKEPYVLLYESFRSFDEYVLSLDEADHTLHVPFEFRDVPVIFFNEGTDPDGLGLGDDVSVQDGPLILPTARKLRITIRSFCSTDKKDYFGHGDFRFSTPVKRELTENINALEEEPLLRVRATTDPLLSIFFRPEPAKTTQELRAAAASGTQNQVDVNIIERLSSICGFNKNGLSVMGKENERFQFGCSHLIGHTLAPDHSSITFATTDDLSRKWISVIQLELNRDWCWDMLEADSFELFRQWKYKRDDGINFEEGVEEKIGVIGLTKGLNWQSMSEPDRLKTRLVFIDALNAGPGGKPVGALQEPAKFPEPVEVRYRVSPRFSKEIDFDATVYDYATQPYNLENTLPITNPPSQVPEIVSVGLALSASDNEEQLFINQYSTTSEQIKYLWIEFAEPVENPNDTYFARLLAYAPDPALADQVIDVHKELVEPAINLDPEIIRIVRPLQIEDNSGLDAMQALPGATADVDPQRKGIRHFLMPLPDGLNPDSPELFGFFTYEFRIGHTDRKWSTAQGRFGRTLRITGVQHPAPKLRLSTLRKPETIEVSAAFAESYFEGNNCTPIFPRTNICALLYAQVLQADGKQYRNILIDQAALRRFSRNTNVEKPVGFTSWAIKDLRTKLNAKGMDINSPLSILAIEIMPDNNRGDINANVIDLENTRILRTSRLYKITDSCPV